MLVLFEHLKEADADFWQYYSIDLFQMLEHDIERAMDLVSVLPPEGRFMTALNPANSWTTENALLSAIEYGLQVINHSITFQHADGKHRQKRHETFPTKLLEPDFITEAREAGRNQRERLSTNDLDALFSRRRVKSSIEQPKIEL